MDKREEIRKIFEENFTIIQTEKINFDITTEEFVRPCLGDYTEFLDKKYISYVIKPIHKENVRIKLECKDDGDIKKLKFEIKIFKKFPVIFENFDFSMPIFVGNDTDETDNIYQPISFRDCNIEFVSATAINNTFVSQRISFERCDIKELQIHKTIFAEEISFYRNVILYVSLSNCVFQKNLYFNHSIFEKKIDFRESEFEKTACFYGVSFEETPNFSQALFKGNLNLVNTNLNFNFEDLELRIQNEFQSYKENKGDSDKKSLENFTNDFRDSFRNFKSTLIKEHNVLDALNYYKVELYCKEIELKQKWDKKGVEAKNEADIKKNISRFKEFIDFLLLNFYRKLCEHHTDFLRVFNNLILLIALYAIFIYIGGFIDDEYLTIKQISNLTNYFVNAKDFFADKPCFLLVAIPALLACCVFYILFICLKNYKDIWKVIKQIFSKSLLIDTRNLIYCSLLVLFISIALIILIPNDMNLIFIFSNNICFLLFLFLYVWLVSLHNIILRYFFIICAYLITLAIIGFNKIALLNPFIGKLVSDKVEVEEPLFVLITFAYTILMALVLFSLQKTARKNSIMLN